MAELEVSSEKNIGKAKFQPTVKEDITQSQLSILSYPKSPEAPYSQTTNLT